MSQEYVSKNLDHLGIVSVVCDEIGILKKVDELIPPDPQMAITFGEILKLMIINGLGFTSSDVKPSWRRSSFSRDSSRQ